MKTVHALFAVLFVGGTTFSAAAETAAPGASDERYAVVCFQSGKVIDGFAGAGEPKIQHYPNGRIDLRWPQGDGKLQTLMLIAPDTTCSIKQQNESRKLDQ